LELSRAVLLRRNDLDVVVGLAVELRVDSQGEQGLAVPVLAVERFRPGADELHLGESLGGVLASLHDPVSVRRRIVEGGETPRRDGLGELISRDERSGEKECYAKHRAEERSQSWPHARLLLSTREMLHCESTKIIFPAIPLVKSFSDCEPDRPVHARCSRSKSV